MDIIKYQLQTNVILNYYIRAYFQMIRIKYVANNILNYLYLKVITAEIKCILKPVVKRIK